MRTLLRVVALAAMSACGQRVTAPEAANDPPATSKDAISTTDGQLKFTVSDAPARPGVMFIAGTIAGGQGMATVSSTRYGSLCSTNIAGHADVAAGTITLQVKVSERLALCTAEVRAITYRAEIGALAPGTYDVKVIHTNSDGTTGSVLTQRIKVF